MIQSFFAQQITFPIQKEIQAFEQIKRTQDYSIRLETNQKDEFSKLAISINELLDYIEKEKNRDQEKQKILQAQAEKDGQITLGFLDIDHFKEVNDTYGHLSGNELLISLAKYLLFYTNQDDIVIRMGGDEFVIFVKNIQNDLNYLCKELMNHLDEITLSHNRLRFSMSMGIYAFNTSLTFDEAFKEADEALYHSKRNGRSQFTIKYQS